MVQCCCCCCVVFLLSIWFSSPRLVLIRWFRFKRYKRRVCKRRHIEWGKHTFLRNIINETTTKQFHTQRKALKWNYYNNNNGGNNTPPSMKREKEKKKRKTDWWNAHSVFCISCKFSVGSLNRIIIWISFIFVLRFLAYSRCYSNR